jgi:hypothetical protein
MLIHAANDYDTSAGRDLAAELERRHKSFLLKIYPAVDKTPDEGHNLLYNSIPVWEGDVFKFLDDNVRRGACEIRTIGHLSHRDWAH